MGISSENGIEQIAARVPLQELSSYSTALSSLTGGRSSFTMRFAAYELVPAEVQEKLLREYAAKNQEE
jgi:elongation factor G